jgi:molybdopterin converting factor small subunit
MADATSDRQVTLELHGFLAERLAHVGQRRGSRTRVLVAVAAGDTVGSVMHRLTAREPTTEVLFDSAKGVLPEHVEVVLNDRLLDLQGGLDARLAPGDVLTFLPAHAGG